MIFTGLSAFPLTPMNEQGVDENAFTRLVEQLAVEAAGNVPGRVQVSWNPHESTTRRAAIGRFC